LELWRDALPAAQQAVVALGSAVADVDPTSGRARGEALEIMVPDAAREQEARAALARVPARFHRVPFGDIWLRDTGPVFVWNERGEVAAARFRFNGWGGKYVLPGDDAVAARIAALADVPLREHPFVLEGGSVESDGEGTVLTTRQCLLNPNRNRGMEARELERALGEALGARKVLWLGQGLRNDHTDGHVDTVARFVRPGVVVCMEPSGPDDPNRSALDAIVRDLEAMVDARGRRLQVVRLSSAGQVLDAEGQLMPASYLNFYIGNRAVVVPTYGTPWDEPAVERIAELFPNRRTVGVAALALLSGGGAFHCITQQQPGRSGAAGGVQP
jgi:agmatine deiminase